MATETKEAISERYLIKDQEASSEAVAGVLRSTKWKSKLMKAARNWLAASSAPLAGKCWNRGRDWFGPLRKFRWCEWSRSKLC